MAHFRQSWQPMWIIHEGQNVVDSGTFYHLGSVRKHSDVQRCPWLSTNTETPLILCTQTTFTSVQPVVFLLLCNCASPFCFRRGPWVTVCSIIILCILLKGAMEQWQLNNGLPVSACEDALGQLAWRAQHGRVSSAAGRKSVTLSSQCTSTVVVVFHSERQRWHDTNSTLI